MPFTVAIVGGGLVGSLAAVYCAKRGWKVDLYEARGDPRRTSLYSGRSINLALSVRGIAAMTAAGVEKKILQNIIPMKGRMIHALDGKQSSQPYGLFGECINSVDRNMMNVHLLECAEKCPNVNVHFDHKINMCDFDKREMTVVRPDGQTVTVQADLVIGADGAHSKIRAQLMRRTRVDFSQTYIDHAYLELSIPPTASGDFAIDPNHLHIWPRQTFMMIALPNLDKSFTVTLFMPWSKFEAVKTEGDVLELFQTYFADAIPHMGRDVLVKEFFSKQPSSLIQVKCRPYHYLDRVLIIGDAAHAMVPFYGQGMNCGMEDLLVLDDILTRFLGPPSSPTSRTPSPVALSAALAEYTATRNPDVEAMCDLAMYNYVEMRAAVTRRSYLFRKKIEGWLHRLVPHKVIPLYTMVSFSRIPYAQALRRWHRQTWWFDAARRGVDLLAWGVVAAAAFWVGKRLRVASRLKAPL